MKHYTLQQKFDIIKNVCNGSSIGIHNFGLLHDIADALGMKNNCGSNLHNISYSITRIMRELIRNNYPVKEYRIKCCSWTERETYHPLFKISENLTQE